MSGPKYFLLTASLIILGAASAHAAGELLRNPDGSVRRLTQFAAIEACPAGTHLPTIREIAEEHQARGAKGILEVSQVNPNSIPNGYVEVSAINQNGQKDEFYFSNEGYNSPGGELNWVFWSSSVYSNDFNCYHSKRYEDCKSAYIAWGFNSNLSAGNSVTDRRNSALVRCFPNVGDVERD